MFKVINALKGSRNSNGMSQPEKTKFVLEQAADFEVALKAMDYVLDDRAKEGLALLEESAGGENEKTIHTLAKGVIEFLEAILGFEAAEMKKASSTLAHAEELSLKSRANAQKLGIRSSSFYPPGTVYAVTYTESCLLHALLMLFSESMMEAAKALLKLRKAYHMLVEIFQAIKKVEQNKKNNNNLYKNEITDSQASFISLGSTFTSIDIPYKLTPEEQEDKNLLQYAEKVQRMRMKRLTGAHIGNSPAINRLRTDLGLNAMKDLPENETTDFAPLSDELDLTQATIDEFINSGVNLCYGILQVVLSLIPPAIGTVLSIVGFKGTREEGLRLIWKSTKHRNIHGCIGLLGLMFYYDGPFQFTDADFDIPAAIKPKKSINNLNSHSTSNGNTATTEKLSRTPSQRSTTASLSTAQSGTVPSGARSRSSTMRSNAVISVDDMDGPTLLHPGKMLDNALLQARALFPNSALWILNEATMLSGKGRLQEAVDLLESIDVEKIEMRQVKSRLIFDRAITLVHLHQYDKAAKDLIYLIDISDWSHALYRYFAGCCYLENYRMSQLGLETKETPEFYKQKATELIFSAPDLLGKKTFKSKNLPLDRFMLRKVESFKAIQKKYGFEDPLDAIATSPVHELSYFYNGYNRMDSGNLKLAQNLLTNYHNPAVDKLNVDQELIRNFLICLTFRRLGEVEKGCQILDEKVLPAFFSLENGQVKYVKKTDDPWLYPAALYERALFTWKLKI
ncbi:hypothetical protein TBLA_0C02820 [Henningerozyma blattae CBS 6284]|uniref:Inclusion body clearance protein IML2 n=1 Tax=Henningerozyma blattae (strain ATCC 34711 / CBS 6284 / DSM 70876 / NBRC 10599 / NRRL Y-10934 / UCD 77-7) TaxID=1071380 RepID=I2H136_HENB6|nr:hypothetical protein TBLA_0C02820 [Tetrapisispora blattae CBS 6284]CCH60088.1 hypothetical protein TBLA_0C02820 [Tetrapisispora blattae CBS 6284]